MKAPQTVSLFSVGFPSDQLQRPPLLVLPHPWSHSVFIAVICVLVLLWRAMQEENCKPGPTSSCVVTSEGNVYVRFIRPALCQLVNWCALQRCSPANRMDSSVHLTQDQCAILALAPKGQSHCPQTATQEGGRKAVVMRLEAFWDKEDVKSLIVLSAREEAKANVCSVLLYEHHTVSFTPNMTWP